jgi:multidrug resistance protein MdtO
MAAIAEARRSRSPFLEFLAEELAPREGRTLAVAHIAIASAITVAIAMVFRIPEPTYMAYLVFLTSKDERGATVTTGAGGQIAVTLAVVVSLGLMMLDLSEPALRLPAMALLTFLAMHGLRVFALGPITYLAGFVVVTLQSVVDDVPNPEALTRLALWLWLVVLVPVVITVLLNLLFGQTVPVLTQRTVRKVLSEMESALLAGETDPHLAHWRELVVGLLEKQPKHGSETRKRLFISVTALRKLADALVILEALPGTTGVGRRAELARKVRACRALLEGETRAPPDVDRPAAAAAPPDRSSETAPAVLALEAALEDLRRSIAHPVSPSAPAAAHKRALFVPDAFTNPAHWQFALKTTIAVMVVYFVYTMLDWPGLRTSIVTCFFVALGSLGETVHKFVLRVSGALIGGLIAGVCIVFVLPHMTDIGQLSVLIALVAAAAGWVATSSELLSYAGLQIAFAFFLGILQDYAPATDLTVLRDRVVGILLGNVVMAVIFSLLWPESAASGLRAALAETLRAIGAVLRRSGDAAEARTRTTQALVRADHFSLLRRFELRMLPKRSRSGAPAPGVADVERLAGAAFVATCEPLLPWSDSQSLTACGRWAEAAAQSTTAQRALPPSPIEESAIEPHSAEPAPLARAAQAAKEMLTIEIAHVATPVS